MAAKRILVVDDSRSIVKALELVLRHEGFEVLTAFDGPGALESVAKHRPDLIVLDIVMPGMSGYEMCQRLSQRPATENIPVIMLTVKGGYEKDDDTSAPEQIARHVRERLRAYDMGAIEFLTKPVIAKKVVARVKQILALVDSDYGEGLG